MVNQKFLAAVVSTRSWDDLEALVRALDTVDLLSPCMNLPELAKSPSCELLDIVFVDADETDFDLDETTKAVGTVSEPYLVFVGDAYNPEKMRVAMQAGGRDFLARPFAATDLQNVLRRAMDYRQSRMAVARRPEDPPPADTVSPANFRILTFFSTKGGAGKSTIAGNFAIALADMTKKRVCIVDLALQFGDLALILNAKPRATLGDLVSKSADHIADEIQSYLTPVRDNVSLLAAPCRPEEAELIRAEHVTETLHALASRFDYVVVDTPAALSDTSLAALDASTTVFLLATPIILSVKNLKSAMDLMENSLHYAREKLKVVLNRSDSVSGITASDIEHIITRKIAYAIPSDGNVVVPSINRGTPAVISSPKSKFSRALTDMARGESGAAAPSAAREKANGYFSLFKWLAPKKKAAAL